MGAVEDLMAGRAGRNRHVVPRAQAYLLVGQPQHAFALEHEEALFVGEVEVEGKGLLAGLDFEPAHAQLPPPGRHAQPLAEEAEVAVIDLRFLALPDGDLAHAFFPNWTSGRPPPRGTAVRLPRRTRRALF